MTAYCLSSSSRMRVIYQNWSATKQRPHPHSVAEISRHSVLSGDRIRQCETSSGSRHKDTDQCKSPFPSAGTAVSLFRAKRVQQRPLLPREVGIVCRQSTLTVWTINGTILPRDAMHKRGPRTMPSCGVRPSECPSVMFLYSVLARFYRRVDAPI